MYFQQFELIAIMPIWYSINFIIRTLILCLLIRRIKQGGPANAVLPRAQNLQVSFSFWKEIPLPSVCHPSVVLFFSKKDAFVVVLVVKECKALDFSARQNTLKKSSSHFNTGRRYIPFETSILLNSKNFVFRLPLPKMSWFSLFCHKKHKCHCLAFICFFVIVNRHCLSLPVPYTFLRHSRLWFPTFSVSWTLFDYLA